MIAPPRPAAPKAAISPWYGIGPALLAATIYLFFFANDKLWDLVIWPQGIAKMGVPFADMHSHLATSHAVASGNIAIGQPIPDDPMHRRYVGPKWLFWMGYTGLDATHTLPFASLSVAVFLATLVVVLRPQGPVESVYFMAVLLSPPVMLLVERGNIDLLVFCVLCGAFALMASAKRPQRWGGWALITAFLGFKYYPAVGYAAFLEAPAGRREKITALLLGLAAVAAFVALTLHEIRALQGEQFGNSFYPWFGAREIWLMIGLSSGRSSGLGLLTWLLGAGLLAVLLGPLGREDTRPDARKAAFVGGASILVFCFLSSSSPDYRLVHFLYCLPWLVVLRRDAGRVRHLTAACLLLFLAVPWAGTLGPKLAVALDSPSLWWAALFAKQLGWWAFMICLGALLLRLLAARARELLGRAPGA